MTLSSQLANRRRFLATSSGLAASLAGSGFFQSSPAQAAIRPFRTPNERPGVGAIGLRYQGSVDAHKTNLYGNIVAVCDVDKNVRDQAKAAFGSTPGSYENYNDLLNRKDVEVVIPGWSRFHVT